MTSREIDLFIQDGFHKIPAAFSAELARECREILWRDTGCDPALPSTWTKPVIRLYDYQQEPFRQAANMPVLHAAFDALAGAGRWQPRVSLGTFPIRFPSPEDPGDTGWHADASFAGEDGSWRLNLLSEGRALLLLFLFSDTGPDDAPTRILAGSHLDVPAILQPHGRAGLSFMELAQSLPATTFERRLELATGNAGDVFVCHPFLIHAAQTHRGITPRFLAQPPLYPADGYEIHRSDSAYSPVEAAIRLGLGLAPYAP